MVQAVADLIGDLQGGSDLNGEEDEETRLSFGAPLMIISGTLGGGYRGCSSDGVENGPMLNQRRRRLL